MQPVLSAFYGMVPNLMTEKYEKMMKAFEVKNKTEFKRYSTKFLMLLKTQDRLLNTKKEFMLGPWLESAKKWGRTAEEENPHELNARTLITSWFFQDSDLHDYAHREWGGLIEDFYLPRWEYFIASLTKELDTKKGNEVIYFKFADDWNHQKKSYPAEPIDDSFEVSHHIYETYFEEI